jgi:predicted N-formylglutamate amidohydrolase
MLKVVITCEHGGNQIPEYYQPLFIGFESLLNSHRGYDLGSLFLGQRLAEGIADEIYIADESRLLVDLNRSLQHPDLFSEVTRALPFDQQQELLRQHYFPYRTAVEKQIGDFLKQGHPVVHLSIHTFTPELAGEERQADIGLLFDPDRESEGTLCKRWQAHLGLQAPNLRVRMNYPYLGVDDGFTTYLRMRFGVKQYAGIELEVNQKFFLFREKYQADKMALVLQDSFRAALAKGFI